MQAIIDRNLLCIDENLDTGKLYQQDFQGYRIESKDKRFFVFHKKEIKLIELKNIGSTMGVFYIRERAERSHLPLEKKSLIWASQLFEAWDEERGEKYAFIPYLSPKIIEEKNNILENLGIDITLKQTEKGVIAHSQQQVALEDGGAILFWLLLLYGKFEAKNWQLNSIKIHLPLFWQYLQLQGQIEELLQKLQAEGIFLQSSLNVQQGKTTLQITSNDYELLQIFADWYSPIEKFTQITKKEQAMQAKDQLLAFISQESLENEAELTQLIQQSVVKILVK